VGSRDDYWPRNDEVWVAPGYSGEIAYLTTGVPSIGNHWSGTITLTLRSRGRVDIVGTAHSDEVWGDAIKNTRADALMVSPEVTIPSDIPAGTDLAGTLTGSIWAPNPESAGFRDRHFDVEESVTFHVVAKDEVTKQQSYDRDLGFPRWCLLILPVLCVFYLVHAYRRLPA
jgi:hypothetical protein